MDETSPSPAPGPKRKLLKYAIVTASLFVVVLSAILVAFEVVDHTPQWVFWAAGLHFLQVVDFAFAVSPTIAIVAAAIALKSRRTATPRARRTWRKIGLLCGSVLLCTLTLEAASAVILRRQGRESVMPPGSLVEQQIESLVAYKMPRADAIELPTTFPEASDAVSIAVVGESSAEGVPFNRWLSIGSVVAWGLGRAIPGRTFQHEVLALSGHTLERQHRALVGIPRRPDVLIVYCGHNEFASRIPIARDRAYYADDAKPALADRLISSSLSWSSFHELVRRTMDKCRIAIPPPAFGRRALVDAPAWSPGERAVLLKDFRERLEAIAAYAERLGAILVLIAPAANDSGFDPNRSYLSPEATRPERSAIEAAFLAAKDREAVAPAEAIDGYRKLLERAPQFAAAHWRLSRLLAGRGESAEAYEQAIAARDLDGYPMRCPTDFQEVYREVAGHHPCVYIDSQAYFHGLSPDGLLDDRLFHDAMHPSLRGQLALAQAVLRGLHARRAFGWAADAPEPVLDPAECARNFNIDANAWREFCLWGMLSFDITGPASYDPTHRRLKYEAFARAADAIKDGVPPNRVGLPNIAHLDPIPMVPYGDPASPPR